MSDVAASAVPAGSPPLRLAVIGDTQHYRDAEGRLCSLDPVVMQLDRWADFFDEVILCAPLDPGPPPAGYAPYTATNVSLVELPRGGGNSLRAKLGLVRLVGTWFRTTRQLASQVDAVHLRCPCNVGMVALFSTWRAVPRRYALYAGVWRQYQGEPFFFGLQRKILGSRWFDGPVSVYADHDPDRPNLEPFFSPSFTDAYWAQAEPAMAAKLARLEASDRSGPWNLVTVGRLTPNKNQRVVIEAVAMVVGAGHDVHLGVYGEGPCESELSTLASSLGIGDRVTFHGAVSHPEVMSAFASADLHLLGTRQEGFGKVLLEGMVHGTVPVFSESPMAEEISGSGTRGLVFDQDDARGLADHVIGLVNNGPRWAAMAVAAREYTAEMTLDQFADRVRGMLERQWHLSLPGQADGDV